ncbi:putative protein with domain of unknown function (DUF4646) [Lyophyllum shimeji]|uniref:BTB domain-containing protein n=1 Tax=Lyophyllum shimeji TaxID=47721 RepID=A0A9P3UUU5_LYOSH|nr:putative protein with domain of unknown function (DUF4646) [Lyophyllum shimeji]
MSVNRQQRIEETPAEASITRSEIWFTDGNIVIEAERAQFRVHRGVLAKQSDVFKGLFDIPTPRGDPTVEGCPIVQVSDTAQDWEHLLNVLYNWIAYSSGALPVPILSAMIRLGHKYDLLLVLKEAVSRVEFEFPSSRTAFFESSNWTMINIDEDFEILELLLVARECKLYRALPGVYLKLARMFNFEKLLGGFPRRDGSLLKLPQEEKLLWMVGLSRLREATMEHTFQWLKHIPYGGCVGGRGQACSTTAKLIYFSVFVDKRPDDLTPGFMGWPDKSAKDMCQPCRVAAKREHEEGRDKLWEALPSFFDLQAWSDLRNFD